MVQAAFRTADTAEDIHRLRCYYQSPAATMVRLPSFRRIAQLAMRLPLSVPTANWRSTDADAVAVDGDALAVAARVVPAGSVDVGDDAGVVAVEAVVGLAVDADAFGRYYQDRICGRPIHLM